MIVVAVIVVALLVAGGLALSGVFTSDTDDRPAADPSATGPATPVPAEPEVIPGKTIGTPTNPYAPGDSFVFLDDWTFTLGATDFDTWPDVAPGLELKYPDEMDTFIPEPGMVFVSAPMSMTYTGPPTYQGRIRTVFVEFMASDGTAHHVGSCGRYGDAVTPFDESDALEQPSVEGAACVEMTPEQAVGGQWRIEIVFTVDDSADLARQIYYTAV